MSPSESFAINFVSLISFAQLRIILSKAIVEILCRLPSSMSLLQKNNKRMIEVNLLYLKNALLLLPTVSASLALRFKARLNRPAFSSPEQDLCHWASCFRKLDSMPLSPFKF